MMPVSVDMNQMLTETPIDDLKNLTSFIKNCKHNIDCYVVRQEQFISLKVCLHVVEIDSIRIIIFQLLSK
jgi:hypothetical protein